MLLSVILLILYTTILRPLMFDYIPGILKRVWLGNALLITPFIFRFILDIVGHLDTSHSTQCFLTQKIFSMNSSSFEPLNMNVMFLFVPNFVYSF